MTGPVQTVEPEQLAEGKKLANVLCRAERQIGLLQRCQPTNAQSERKRLVEELTRGQRPLPAWRYANRSPLDDTRRLLDRLLPIVTARFRQPELWLERIVELQLEAQLAQAVGTDQFPQLARRRYTTGSAIASANALSRAKRWVALPCESSKEELVRSDDRRDTRSLLRTIESLLDRFRVPFQVETKSDLASVAATGSRTIFVGMGHALTQQQTRRIAWHEVLGHALPRAQAPLQSHGLFAAGAANCNEQEEGRAILIEQRESLLDPSRCRELGLRHVLATAGHAGQTWAEAALFAHEVLKDWAASVDLASRVHRGGGLFRESCYLLALEALEPAFEVEPTLDNWFQAGRMTLHSISILRQAGHTPVVPTEQV